MAELIKMCCMTPKMSIAQVAEEMKKNLYSEFVCDERRLGACAIMFCFEDFYFRCSSYVGLSIMLTENQMCQEAVIAGFGGGDGLLNISWGANKSFAKRAVMALKDYGFEEQREM